MKAIYPGSFDPVTNGHLDIIERTAAVFDELIVAVAVNREKTPMFTVEERADMLREACAHLPNVRVDYFHGMLVDYVVREGAAVVVRSLRAVSDFEYEFQMALMNKRLNDRVETVFLTTSAEHLFLSSSLVKEVAELGASLAGLAPPCVEEKIRQKLMESGQEAEQI